MLVSVRDRIAEQVAAGKDVEQVVASAPLADLDSVWGGGFVNSEALVRAVHASLSAAR